MVPEGWRAINQSEPDDQFVLHYGLQHDIYVVPVDVRPLLKYLEHYKNVGPRVGRAIFGSSSSYTYSMLHDAAVVYKYLDGERCTKTEGLSYEDKLLRLFERAIPLVG